MAKKPRKLNNGGGTGKVSGLASGVGATARHDIYLIDDETILNPVIKDAVLCPVMDNEVKGFGLVPRKHSIYPASMFEPPSEMPLVPPGEVEARAKALQEGGMTFKQLLTELNIPAMDQGQNGYCLPAMSLIHMADGSQERIEDVKLFDRVLSAEGNICRVAQCHAREHKGEMATVETQGHGRLRLTPNHEVLTQRGYVPAAGLTADDWARVPHADTWLKVHTVEREPYEGMVYNLGVEGDNSYVAEGVGVHNCWSHSVTGAMQAMRAKAGLIYTPLSAYCIAATLKRGQNEGGWAGLAAAFVRAKGTMPQSIWPQGDRDYKKYDKPENWAEALKYKTTEEWVDLTRNVYDQNLLANQVQSSALFGNAMANDFSWWSHSVLVCDIAVVEAGSTGNQGRNSWGPGWGDNGWFVLRGQKALTNGALAIRVLGAAA